MPELHDSEFLLYLQLAWASQVRRRPMVCDKLLVLAAAAATRRQHDDFAESCRELVLISNPGHLLRQFESMHEAATDGRFDVLHERLRREFPRERAEHMLASLELELTAGEEDVDAERAVAGDLLDRLRELRSAAAPAAPPASATGRPRFMTLGAIVVIAAIVLAIALASFLASG